MRSRKLKLFVTILLIMVISASALLAMATTKDEKRKAALKRYIELLDSNDYVLTLRNNKKVRIREKPTIDAKSLVWVYIRKKSGQYNLESIHKTLIDFEKTEEYNRKMDKNRKIRNDELARRKKQQDATLAMERLESGKITDTGSGKVKVYTGYDLKQRKKASGVLNVSDIVNLEDHPGWEVIVITEAKDYENTLFSVNKPNGDVLLSGSIKDLLVVKDYIDEQTKAYDLKIQDEYRRGTEEGDKFKYSGIVVEIQNILHDLKKKKASIKVIIEKLPNKKVNQEK